MDSDRLVTYTFNFGVPTGETGDKGATGPEGPMPSVAVGSTTVLPVNSDGTSKDATVTLQ